MKATFTHRNFSFSFVDSDVVNPTEYIPAGEYNPHNVRPWLLHDHGLTLAIVFASCFQDALDEAVDGDKLDRFLVADSDLADYGDEEEGITRLGNAGEPFDIEGLDFLELPYVPFSFAAMFMAAMEAEKGLLVRKGDTVTEFNPTAAQPEDTLIKNITSDPRYW